MGLKKTIKNYLIQLKLIFRFSIYKLHGRKIIIINEASGLGDYLWIRPIFRLLKESHEYKKSAIVLLGTERWKEFALKFDSDYCDDFIFFDDPHNPKPRELIALKLFTYEYFINFRHNFNQWENLNKSIKSSKEYYNTSIERDNLNEIYKTRFKNIIEQIFDKKFFLNMDLLHFE